MCALYCIYVQCCVVMCSVMQVCAVCTQIVSSDLLCKKSANFLAERPGSPLVDRAQEGKILDPFI